MLVTKFHSAISYIEGGYDKYMDGNFLVIV